MNDESIRMVREKLDERPEWWRWARRESWVVWADATVRVLLREIERLQEC